MQRVYFIRHGLSEANVLFYAGKVDQSRAILDPALAPRGEEQARAVSTEPLLSAALAMPGDGDGDEAAQLLVVSPLRRTIQTAHLAFEPWLAARATAGAPVPIVLCPDIQETGDVLGDTGRPVSEVRGELPNLGPAAPLPWDEVPERWCEKSGMYAHTGTALAARFDRFCRWLARRPERNIIVVGHHNVFLGMLSVTFRNCEVREYSFDGEGRGGAEPLPMPLTCDLPAGTAPAPTPPFVCEPSGKPAWTALSPLVSTCDEEMSEEDREWVANPTMLQHNVSKLELWGFPKPARWR